ACRRSTDVEFPYRSRRQRYTRSVSRHLHEYHGHPALPGRRSRYRGSVGERYSRPCRLRHGITDVASDSSAARFGRGPSYRSLCVGRMERHAVCATAPATYLNSLLNVRFWPKADIGATQDHYVPANFVVSWG